MISTITSFLSSQGPNFSSDAIADRPNQSGSRNQLSGFKEVVASNDVGRIRNQAESIGSYTKPGDY
jgi:hypothetical protein